MLDIWQQLKKQDRPIVLYGMGNGADIMLDTLYTRGIKVSGVFASDDFVRGQTFRGFKVQTFSSLKAEFPDMIVLVSFGTQLKPVIQHILSLDAPVYAPEVPVVGNNVFDIDFLNANRSDIEAAYSLLADDRSRYVFEQLIRYKLDGCIKRLIDAEDTSEAMMKLFSFDKNTRYLDLGAYTGDTVNEFLQYCPEYASVTAVEPDIKNFKKLANNTATLGNVTLINAAVSDICGTVSFSTRGGRNSRLEAGRATVQAITVDSLKTDFSFIKFDVEGQEYNALKGCRNTITEYKPQMLVSAYHRSEDIFTLPLYVHSLRPDYKIYLRHQPYIPAWDTNYCFI